jgi:hypothetical protein
VTDPDYDPEFPNRVDVRLHGGPYGGQLAHVPGRVAPASHLLVLPGDPPRWRAGSNPPEDITGWLLYTDNGVTTRTREWDFGYVGTLAGWRAAVEQERKRWSG